MVVSEYIKNPMLINGYKFDLRIYVAITSINPLRVYRFKNGLVRFASEIYQFDDSSEEQEICRHLTNTSLFSKTGSNTTKKWEFTQLIAHMK